MAGSFRPGQASFSIYETKRTVSATFGKIKILRRETDHCVRTKFFQDATFTSLTPSHLVSLLLLGTVLLCNWDYFLLSQIKSNVQEYVAFVFQSGIIMR